MDAVAGRRETRRLPLHAGGRFADKNVVEASPASKSTVYNPFK